MHRRGALAGLFHVDVQRVGGSAQRTPKYAWGWQPISGRLSHSRRDGAHHSSPAEHNNTTIHATQAS